MRDNKAQTMIEYTVLIAALVAALVAMFSYLSFAIQGRFRQGADVFGQGEQYEPGVTRVE